MYLPQITNIVGQLDSIVTVQGKTGVNLAILAKTNAGVGTNVTVTGGAATGAGNAAGNASVLGGSAADGNGGAVALTGAAGVGTSRDGGTISLTTGAGTAGGTTGGAGGSTTVTLGAGGNGTTAAGGAAGSFTLTGAAGGTATTGTGGAGSGVTLTLGAGGAATGAAGIGGEAGNLSFAGAVGGASTLAAGGGGSDLTLTAGTGGAGATTGGAAGVVTLTAGVGGAGTTANAAGGNVAIVAGAAGAGAGTAAAGGSITLLAGDASGAAADGRVVILKTTAGASVSLRFEGGTSGSTDFRASLTAVNPTDGYYTWPATAPSTGQVLSSTAAGQLSWVSNTSNLTIRTITASDTQVAGDDVILIDNPGAGAVVLTLLPAASFPSKKLVVKRIDANTGSVTIDGDGVELIDETATVSLPSQWQAVTIVPNASTGATKTLLV